MHLQAMHLLVVPSGRNQLLCSAMGTAHTMWPACGTHAHSQTHASTCTHPLLRTCAGLPRLTRLDIVGGGVEGADVLEAAAQASAMKSDIRWRDQDLPNIFLLCTGVLPLALSPIYECHLNSEC